MTPFVPLLLLAGRDAVRAGRAVKLWLPNVNMNEPESHTILANHKPAAEELSSLIGSWLTDEKSWDLHDEPQVRLAA